MKQNYRFVDVGVGNAALEVRWAGIFALGLRGLDRILEVLGEVSFHFISESDSFKYNETVKAMNSGCSDDSGSPLKDCRQNGQGMT